MNHIFTYIFIGFLALSVQGQNRSVQGQVTDAQSGRPLPNATITPLGLSPVFTDQNGLFQVECKDTLTMTIAFLGYETSKIMVPCPSTQVRIALVSSAIQLQEVEITAAGLQEKRSLYQPVSIASLGLTEIRRGMGLLMEDAININIPGVSMQRRTFSAGQQFNIRGYGNGIRGTNGANSNFDGQGYKVYLNGIPVTDAEGITLMDDLDFGSVGNVEVIKGPAGSLYGQAIAGVVHLQTIKPAKGVSSIGQELVLGSYGLQRHTTTLQIGREKASLLVNYGNQKYTGFMSHTASSKDFVNVIGTISSNDRLELQSYFGYSNSYDQRNGEITPEQWKNKDYSGNPAYIKNDAHSNVISFRTGTGITYRMMDNITSQTSVFGTGMVSNVSSAGGWTDKSSINFGFRSTLDCHFSLTDGVRLSGTTGLEAQGQKAQTMGYPMVPDSFNLSGYNLIGSIRSNQYTQSGTMAVFSEWKLELPHDVAVTVGLGWSGLSMQLNDRLYNASNNSPIATSGKPKPIVFQNSFTEMFSPHIALNKVFNKNVSLYTSFSQGYKAPVSSYFFVPLTGEVLKGLKPEKGVQLEVGSKGVLAAERFQYQVSLFYIRYTDKMTAIAVANAANTATSYVYITNAGTQNNKGLEVSLNALLYKSDNVLKTLNLFSNLTYSHFQYGNFAFQKLSSDKKSVVNMDFSNKVVAGVPPITFNAGIDLTTRPGIYFNLTYSYRDRLFYTSDNLNEAGTFELLNTKLGVYRNLSRHFAIDAYFGVNNLTKHQNYAMVFVNQLPDAFLPAPSEVNYFGGVQVKYIF